jgi:predicted methyltransferase
MITRRHALSAVAALSLFATAPLAMAADPAPSAKIPPIPAYIQKAVDSPDRPDKDKARDVGRKPAEVFALSGIKPGDKVIEIAAFGQYDTNIMVNIVGPKGHIYMYDLPYQQARQEAPTKVFTDAHPTTEHVFGKFDELTFPKNVDLVTIDMYYHDLGLNKVDQTIFNKQMFDALKPGGRVLIVDHNATPGSGRTTTATVHRIDPALPPQEMEAAGFKMIVNSSMFANPADDKTKRVFEPTERGSTDRSIWVFQKPK